jgi:hypothetical protein
MKYDVRVHLLKPSSKNLYCICVQIIFKNSVRTAMKTQHFTITKINWLTMFNEIIAVYSENHTRPIIQNAELLIVKSRWYICLPLGFKVLNHER